MAAPQSPPAAYTVHFSRFSFQLRRQHLFLAAACLFALAAALPLILNPGFLNTRGGGDSPFLLQRLHQLETAVRDGHFPARWMPDANYGLGYPFYNFYAPLSIYIALFFRFLGFTTVGAIEAAQLLGFLVAAAGMFELGRRWLQSDWAGLLTAVAYTFAPFHMVNIYVRGDSLAEFWAMACYPWILLAADNVINCLENQESCRREISLLALAYAALVLSHNISALIFSPFLLLYILLRLWLRPVHASLPQSPNQNPNKQTRRANMLPPLLLALLLALALSAWFFIPALLEQELAQLDPVTEGYFHFSNHFRGADLVQTSLWFDYSVNGGSAFRMGLLQALTAVLGSFVILTRRSLPKAARLFILLTLLIATFMLTPLSRFLWDTLPLLPFTQFPWRFLSVQALPAALATGALALLPGRRLLTPLLAVLLALSGLALVSSDHLRLTDNDITAAKLAQYEWFTGNIGSTVSAEYLPPGVKPRPFSSAWLNGAPRESVHALQGDLLAAVVQEHRTGFQKWAVETAVSGATLIFPTLYWPGWSAAVDGTTAEINPAPGSGQIQLDIPAGVHTVTLRLTRTPVRLFAELLSLTAVLLLIWLLRPRPHKAWLLPTAAILITALAAYLWPRSELPPDNLTWDFAQMGYLHHDTNGIQFENGAVLSTYQYSQESVSAGDQIAITLNWELPPAEDFTLALTTPAAAWPVYDPSPPVIVKKTLNVPAAQETVTLAVPPNAPPGLLIPRLTLTDARALMPSGQTRGDLFLRPLLLKNSQSAAHANLLDARAVDVLARGLDALDVQLAWFTERPLSENYAASLRLLNPAGATVAQLDTQPGYGFQPSSAWQAGAWTHDWLALGIPQSLSATTPYALAVRLYAVESGEVVLTRRLGTVRQEETPVFEPHRPQFTLPEGVVGETAVFQNDTTALIQWRGYEAAQMGTSLDLTLYWEALANDHVDYTRFVHLIDAKTGQIVAQNDAYPQGNSYPTSQWTPGEIVVDPLRFDLSKLPPGDYAFAFGFYTQEGAAFTRLTAVTANGKIWPENRVLLTDDQLKVMIPQPTSD